MSVNFLFRVLFILYSKLADNGLIINRIKKPTKRIDKEIGLKISKIDKPIFLIEINSLLLIKFLKRKAIDTIITKGIV